ncbi:MAG: hypothetical protein MUQ30_06095, partial [Anaerolineae bacterium]|nr:hypothetical protein [Anaerolineae bacterium]
ILVQQNPDALYVWAWKGQVGTTETCDDPELAWQVAVDVLRLAKETYDEQTPEQNCARLVGLHHTGPRAPGRCGTVDRR